MRQSSRLYLVDRVVLLAIALSAPALGPNRNPILSTISLALLSAGRIFCEDNRRLPFFPRATPPTLSDVRTGRSAPRPRPDQAPTRSA